jgi:hypothetical protein
MSLLPQLRRGRLNLARSRLQPHARTATSLDHSESSAHIGRRMAGPAPGKRRLSDLRNKNPEVVGYRFELQAGPGSMPTLNPGTSPAIE